MLRHIYLLAFISFITARACFGQCYIDSTDGNFGFNPGNRAWQRIYQGKPYAYEINVYEPTGVTTPQMTFYNIIIDTLTGLPPGITYTKNPNIDTLISGGHQCIEFSGITTAPIGPYPVHVTGTINYSIYGGPPTSSSIANFSSILTLIPSGFTTGFTDTLELFPPLGMDNIEGMASQTTITPNPSNGKFELSLEFPIEETTSSVSISDITGRIVYRKDVNEDGFYKTSIDLSGFPKGLYMAEIKTSAGTIVKKVSLQ